MICVNKLHDQVDFEMLEIYKTNIIVNETQNFSYDSKILNILLNN